MNDSAADILRIPRYWPRRLVVGAALVVVSWGLVFLRGAEDFLWLAVLTSAFSLISLRHIQRVRHLCLDADGLTVEPCKLRIPLEGIEGITTRPRLSKTGSTLNPRRDVLLIHRKGEIIVPPRATGRKEWLGALSRGMERLDPVRNLPGELAAFHREESAKFGSEHVLTARVFTRLPGLAPTRGMMVDSFLSMTITGLVLLWLPADVPGLGGRPAGGSFLGFGAFFLFLTLLVNWSRRSVIKRLSGSGLVVSPGGLALCYGKLQGKLGWDELADCKLTGRSGSRLLRLTVPGSAILLPDFFDRPIAEIYEAIQSFAALNNNYSARQP